LGKDEVQSKKGELSAQSIFPEPGEQTNAPEPGEQSIFPEPGKQTNAPEPSAKSIFPEPGEQTNAPEQSAQTILPEPTTSASERKQKCPMCGGHMDYYIAEGKWQCYSCGFEYLGKDASRGKSEEKSSMTQKTHPHPVLPLEGEGVADKDRSNALLAIPLTEELFDRSSTTRPSPGYWQTKKTSLSSRGLPAIKKKTCPACAKKMLWHELNKAWQCPHCGYERRI
jgi:ribosomal protein L37AE/L43A